MKRTLVGLWQARSFIAGILIGLSIVVPVFASMGASQSHWQTLLVFSSPIILAAGVTLQALVTAKTRAPARFDPETRWKSAREARSPAGTVPQPRALSHATWTPHRSPGSCRNTGVTCATEPTSLRRRFTLAFLPKGESAARSASWLSDRSTGASTSARHFRSLPLEFL